MAPIGEADVIIQQHVRYAMAAAAIPVPLADIAAVTLVQLDMVRALSRRYAVDYDGARSNALLVSLAGASLARVGASLFKAVPVVGSLVGIAAQVVLSGAATYAAGQVFRGIFEESGTLASVDADQLRERYAAYVERGRELAQSLRDVASAPAAAADVERAASLDRLERLRRAGVITDDEFERLSDVWIEDADPDSAA